MPDSFIKHENDYDWSEKFDFNGKTAWQKFINRGTDDTPEVFLVKHEPGVTLPPHSHSQDEIIYVLEGQISVQDKPCPAGSVIFVKRNVVYGPLTAGPKGVKYLNIRPTKAV